MRLLNTSYRFWLVLFIGVILLPLGCSKDDGPEGPLSDTEGVVDEDNPERIAAKQLYQSLYVTSTTQNADPSWSGNFDDCDAGQTADLTRHKILQRVSYYRNMVGLENTITENTQKSSMAQQTAYLMAANNRLDHNPGTDWKCYSEDGKTGARNSLLTTAHNAEAVDAYIRDRGANNGPVGHRRWLLFPRLTEIGIGNTSQSNALWVLGNYGPVPDNAPEFIAWPPKGYVPSHLVFERWSFSVAQADFSEAQVKVTNARNQEFALTVEELVDGFGDPTIVFIPQDLETDITGDIPYTVTISNVQVNGETKEYSYTVTLFNVNE
jgi:uncharacterized protein YkwD